jgi:hypothetical protein
MNTKLTLRLDEELIAKAKVYAERSGTSVSGLVSDFFDVLTSDQPPVFEITPRVRALRGVLKGYDIDEEDYKRHLLRKYG